MRTLLRSCALAATVASSGAVCPLRAQTRPTAGPRASFAEPGISPDGREIAFASGGDIWVVPATGGDARLLVSHPATESRPMYSPDGKRLAFMSNRAGSVDIWVLTLATSELRRLTFDDGTETLDGWSRDGRWIYFNSPAHDASGADEYRVRADGGTPMIVSGSRHFSEFMGAPSPDGSTIALVARGMSQSQWWRKGRSHLDESELWLARLAGDGSGAPTYRQLTSLGAKRQWPMWSADGRAIYFVSDEGGPQNLWSIAADGGSARPLTHFRDGRVLYPTITADGRTIAFERDFAVWTADVATGEVKPVPITLRGAITTPDEHLTLTSFQEMAVSPDGRKMALTARGDVFAVGAAEGGDAMRVTHTPAVESQLAWAPDSRRLAYASNRDGAWHIYLYDFESHTETQLTRGDRNDVQERWSPDGSRLAFVRDAQEVHVLDVRPAGGSDRVVARGIFSRPPFAGPAESALAWSPDGRHIAFLSAGAKLMVNAHVVAVEPGVQLASKDAADQVSFLSNTATNGVAWSPDGTYLLLHSGMRTEPALVARVDLVPHVPKMREAQFDALFRDETPGRAMPSAPSPAAKVAADSASPRPAGPVPARVVLDGIRDRMTVLPTGLDVGAMKLSPDGQALLLVANAAGQQNLYVYPLDELATEPAVARQLTSTAGGKSSVQWAPDGKSVYYLEQGRINTVAVDTRAPKQLTARAEVDVEFDREKMEVFHQAWEFLRDNFYDPNFHGTDWNAVHAAYAPFIAGSRTPDEMRRVLSLMIGEMNGSHMGIGSPPPQPGTPLPSTGRLGLFFDRTAYEQRGTLEVSEAVPLSPAAIAGIKVRDAIAEFNGVPLGGSARVSLDSLLAYTVGKRVVLGLVDGATNARREVALRPVSGATERGLLYRAWVDSRRAYVEKASGGRLGYVHMADMGGNAINQLNLDLDSDNHMKEGVVLDIRDNNGGFVNGYALDILSRQPYVMMVRRGTPMYDGRPILGQRALEAPTILVTNQATLSDGENFTEGYRTMHLGKVVGEPTAGWDVYTGAGVMVDGTSVRLPFMRNAQLDGTALELRPRQVDIPVEQPLGESYTGKDVQLDAAVKELLRELDAKRAEKGGR